MVEIGSTIYTFMGEELLKLEVVEFIDALRLSAKDNECTYCVYKTACYEVKQNAIDSMRWYLNKLESTANGSNKTITKTPNCS